MIKSTWWRSLLALPCLTLLCLTLAGCASYYEDRYYGYYDDHGYYDGAYHYPRSHGHYGYSSYPYHYDLYDPYLSLFVPFGWIYDPWHFPSYRFGVHLYPYRHFGFAFYGGRPWFHSPWYGGYGLYYPYFWHPRHVPQQSTPTYRGLSTGPGTSAMAATRGMAAGLQQSVGTPDGTYALVRTSPVTDAGFADRGSALLGTMSLPTESRPQRVVRVEQEPGTRLQRQPHVDTTPGPDVGMPLGRNGFPLSDRSLPDRGSAVQSLDDTRAADPGFPRAQRWQEGPRLQRWPAPVSTPAPASGWPAAPARDLRRTDPGPAWQGRGDAFRGGAAGPSPARMETPQRTYSAPRMERSSGGDGGTPRGDHGRNQHEE